MKEGKINRADTINLLRKITKYEERNTDYVEDPIVSPFGMNKERWRYTVLENGDISVQRFRGKTEDGQSEIVSLRQFIWNRLNIDYICQIYERDYENWMEDNCGVPYIDTEIMTEYNNSRKSSANQRENKDDFSEKEDYNKRVSSDFFRDFCTKMEEPGLRLLMGEYGMGKSSFCSGFRKWARDKNQETAFCNGEMAFPLIFDLNDYQSRDFKDYLQVRLIDQYNLNISFEAFMLLCQQGFFYVVLDAWDQMHHTDDTSISLTISDINQFSVLWENAGKVLITCRRSFYQQQLHNKEGVIYKTPIVKIYNLKGFDINSVKKYFREANGSIDDDWAKKCWSINQRLFERPINTKLLAKHFASITESYSLDISKVDTYQFLDCILNEWKKDAVNANFNSDNADAALKLFVHHSLVHGLTRTFPIDNYKRELKQRGMNPKTVINALEHLDFVKIGYTNMEFKLAAYQEFLWAHYALNELDKSDVLDHDTLINRFKLNPDVRAWMAGQLTQEGGHSKGKQLLNRLNLVRYRDFGEVGYSASNALTLLRDLSNEDGYKEVIKEVLGNLQNLPLNGADLRGMDLSNAVFENSLLIDADLSYTTLKNVNFKFSNLSNAEWDEYEKLSKCAFLTWEHDNIVASGTKSGGILTFNIDQLYKASYNLYKDNICGIVADSVGVYTAGKSGWTSFLSNEGTLKTVFINGGGLESIASGGTNQSSYIGTSGDGLLRYDWRSSNVSNIEIENSPDKNNILNSARNVHYAEINDNQYVAYIQDRNKLVLLTLDRNTSNGTIIATGTLNQFKFGDLCFAGENVVFHVFEKGIYYRPISKMIDKISETDLLNNSYLLFSYRKDVELAWAEETKKLFVVQKSPGDLTHLDCYSYSANYKDFMRRTWDKTQIELGPYYVNSLETKYVFINAATIDGMCVSADGTYLAFAGESLAVFKKTDDDPNYYLPACEMIEAKIQYQGSDFRQCDGLNAEQKAIIKSRGGLV